jgi:hypothetical protein
MTIMATAAQQARTPRLNPRPSNQSPFHMVFTGPVVL